MELARRLCGFLLCRRRPAPVADYVLLQPSEDVELRELQAFLEENFKQLDITPEDLRSFSRDTEVVNHLLKLVPLYRQCQSKCLFLKGYLADGCLPHTRPAAEVECRKSQRILEALDILILKLVVGEFVMSDTESLEMLLDKFSTDQASLLEVQKVMGLVDMDCEKSAFMLDAAASSENAELEGAVGGVDVPSTAVSSSVSSPASVAASHLVGAFTCPSITATSLIPENTGVTRPPDTLGEITTLSTPSVIRFDPSLLPSDDDDDERDAVGYSKVVPRGRRETSEESSSLLQERERERFEDGPPVREQPQGRSHRRHHRSSSGEREVLSLLRQTPEVPQDEVVTTPPTLGPPPIVGSARELRGVKKKRASILTV
ncbi:tegument protein UL51 [Panine betaherpesvirus 2]|uniref:Tegument protein UL51 homolog n=1 Tax=Panine betaherpesvirus 2 TaxID=188763 RepID=Q8QS28_9BETA|nr:tegument protein UL51 [Panine betaherpesvirus 2]AAM00710.1 tegument protein UL51 [Panine betaherpesvirus 2]QXV67818.1 tegument protein UL51 [Panine betaherpesvirus 2]